MKEKHLELHQVIEILHQIIQTLLHHLIISLKSRLCEQRKGFAQLLFKIISTLFQSFLKKLRVLIVNLRQNDILILIMELCRYFLHLFLKGF